MKRILFLVLSHKTHDETFKAYKDVWDKIIETTAGRYPIDVLFLYSDEEIQEEYVINGNHLITKCKENYWYALLLKVICGFKFFEKSDYDLVFKTNLSTIVNFDKFYDYCSSIDTEEFVYEGCVGHYLDYSFCSGAGMLLNKKTVRIVLNNVDKIDEKWTDDIFIGYVLNKLNKITPKQNGLSRLDFSFDTKMHTSMKDYTHYRIKIRQQNKDIYFANEIFDLLYN
jgi:hypothetical protein